MGVSQPVVPRSHNITTVNHHVSVDERARTNGHRGAVVWLTGLSGSGKSTLAMGLERRLFQMGWQAYVLDGDNVRGGLCSDLGFSHQDRTENIRRVGEVAHLFAKAGLVVIAAFISPYRADRERVRDMAPDAFHEIHVAAPLEVCENRDPKGLYKKARRGDITDFTGISAPYEPPENPALAVATQDSTEGQSIETLLAYVTAQLSVDLPKR